MEITLLIKSVMGLIVILAVLIFLLFLPSTKKKKQVSQQKNDSSPDSPIVSNETQNTSLEYLRSVIKNKKSTTSELKNALELVIKHHGIVHEKIGERAHPDFDIYMDILFTICRHPNTNKDVILTLTAL
ncbi:hypothetical protein [Sulfurimonas sp.]|uniref:hypothetical protein n=1 Tax=Sulfurimonas sp. TaxID=2022749 RepID=UPI002AAF893B|nr:hypothetical protein [Sulfurimonas sp.]